MDPCLLTPFTGQRRKCVADIRVLVAGNSRVRTTTKWYFEKIARMAKIHVAATAAVKDFSGPLVAFAAV